MHSREDFKNELKILKQDGESFLKRELTLHEFKSKSGRFGMYAERGGQSFMVRMKMPCGICTPKYLKLLEDIVSKYNIEKFHLTTRQAIQFHNLSLDDACNIISDFIDNDLITYGCGGNFPRNVTLSHLSGVEKGEYFDPTEYALAVNEYFVNRILSYKLPRKLKVGFSNSSKDISITTLTDLGFLAQIKDGKKYFKLFIAGGLGKSPSIGAEFDELIEPNEILYYVEALVNLFIEHGNFENRNKARLRYIIQEKGKDEFLSLYKSYVKKVKEKGGLDLNISETSEIPNGEGKLEEDANIIEQKQDGRYTVLIKPIGGNISSNKFKEILNFLNTTKSKDLLRLNISMEESMYVNNLTADEAKKILEICKDINQTTRLSQSISCIGVPICQIGIGESQSLLNNILTNFKEKGLNKDLLPKYLYLVAQILVVDINLEKLDLWVKRLLLMVSQQKHFHYF